MAFVSRKLDRIAIACTVGADLCVCPGLGLRITAGADTQVCPGLGLRITAGADAQVCPGLGLRITAGADTQVCPYTVSQCAINWRKIELVKRNKLLVHNLQLRRLAVTPHGHTMKRAIVFRIFCRGNSISINGTMGISAAAARSTSALTPKGKNLVLFTVS